MATPPSYVRNDLYYGHPVDMRDETESICRNERSAAHQEHISYHQTTWNSQNMTSQETLFIIVKHGITSECIVRLWIVKSIFIESFYCFKVKVSSYKDRKLNQFKLN